MSWWIHTMTTSRRLLHCYGLYFLGGRVATAESAQHVCARDQLECQPFGSFWRCHSTLRKFNDGLKPILEHARPCQPLRCYLFVPILVQCERIADDRILRDAIASPIAPGQSPRSGVEGETLSHLPSSWRPEYSPV